MEYDLTNPASWIVYPEPPCDPSFDRELLAIGGTNPHGQPMLRKVWGATHRSKGELTYKIYESEPEFAWHEFRDPETGETRRVKTTSEIPAGVLISVPIYESVELGELRWIIERWVGPAELEKQGYFDPELQKVPLDPAPTLGLEAKRELHAMIQAGETPETALASVEGQLDRARPAARGEVDVDPDVKAYFDPEWRTHGDYQFFFRLQRRNGLYHPPDGEALEAIRWVWNYNATVSEGEHQANLDAISRAESKQRRENVNEVWTPGYVDQYRDESGATHTLWQGRDGSGNAQIDFTI